MPKINEQIAVHLSKHQLLDLIKDEVLHLQDELISGVPETYRAIKRSEIIHRAEQIERLAGLLPK